MAMTSGQVSVWVPIAVALLAGVFGIVGVVTGNLLQSKRERLREDLRWLREQTSVREQNQHDLTKHWTTIRLDLLSEILHILHEWRELLIPLADDHFHERPLDKLDTSMERIRALTRQLQPLLIRLPLVASAELTEMINSLEDHFSAWTKLVQGVDTYPGMAQPIDTIDGGFDLMVTLMKRELGLDLERATHVPGQEQSPRQAS